MTTGKKSCCQSGIADKPYIIGRTQSGKIPVVSSELTLKDRLGALKVRLSINRMNYKIEPGLYGIGNPDKDSNVFISCNYKLSFDILRKDLAGIDAWIMVLDTKGINVWCAAGKGTFGTEELVNRIKTSKLEKIVEHKRIIVPQLGAPGISAHSVQKETGFRIKYGPVRSSDIKEFIKSNYKATADMRLVKFTLKDRLKLVPVEFAGNLKIFSILLLVFFILSGINKSGYSVELMLSKGTFSLIVLGSSFLLISVLGPMLLPFIPGRAFSLKGFIIGLLTVTPVILLSIFNLNVLSKISFALLISVIASYSLMNFTGSSTYTSLSGVAREMGFAVPLQLAALICGTVLFVLSSILI